MFIFTVDYNVLTEDFADNLVAYVTGHLNNDSKETVYFRNMFLEWASDSDVIDFTICIRGLLDAKTGLDAYGSCWPSSRFKQGAKNSIVKANEVSEISERNYVNTSVAIFLKEDARKEFISKMQIRAIKFTTTKFKYEQTPPSAKIVDFRVIDLGELEVLPFL